VPVIATTVGGIPELVINGTTGILIPPENPEKLLEEINNLLQNKEYAKKLADAAYDFVVNNMTWDTILPKYVKFYESLLKS
jgi:glycosyltransferase involved in cell wall biosynthesis